ncbi:efflux RND transporter periplasmic adaptor subunit [Thermodesulfobacteriota bacterium]
MDRKIEKEGITLKKLTLIIIICAVIGFLVYQVIIRSGTTRLKVDPNRITVSKVAYGEFRDYYPFDGRVVPYKTVIIALEQGGRVEEILKEGGESIQKGDLILRLSNPSVLSSNIQRETQIREQIHNLANSQINSEQTLSTYRENIMQRELDLKLMERQFERYKTLRAENIAITEEEFENLRDKLENKKKSFELYKDRVERETILIKSKLEVDEKSLQRYNYALELLEESMKSLEVTARISGHLSELNAEEGQNLPSGHIIGQIHVLDRFKIYAQIDQYYDSKVEVGTIGKFSLDGKDYEVQVTKKYSAVQNDLIPAELAFIGELPEGIKRGHSLSIELEFNEAEKSLMVKKGGFFNQTSGRWVYLISEDGKTAHRQDIRVSNHNPRYVVVVEGEGLKEGDWIITSGYDTFKEADELIFTDLLDLED